MVHPKGSESPPAAASAVKSCPWCGGALGYRHAYPVTRLAPGECRRLRDDDIPEVLRTVPAWTCLTPLCKYREPA